MFKEEVLVPLALGRGCGKEPQGMIRSFRKAKTVSGEQVKEARCARSTANV